MILSIQVTKALHSRSGGNDDKHQHRGKPDLGPSGHLQ